MRAVKFAQNARPYFFEIFTAGNILLFFVAYPDIIRMTVATFPILFLPFVVGFLVQVLIGVLIRIAFAYFRGTLPELLAGYRSAAWIADTVRITIFTALWWHAYIWIKLASPIMHPRFFDQQLWDIDRAIGFGYSPTVFLVTLFSSPAVMRFFDIGYVTVLFPALSIVPAVVMSMTTRQVRIAFMNSTTLLWLISAWLYVAVPALGPAYRFPEVWLPLAPYLPETQTVQRMLMSNFRAVQLSLHGIPRPINIFMGVAAFPSLHVGFQVLAFLWMRRLMPRVSIVFGLIALFTLIASVVTGWHYLVDGIAGGLLAWAAYAAAQRVPAIRA
jgi:membrane-associated phospholipid phosphatase